MNRSYLNFYYFPFLLFIISWVHFFNTKSLKVDENPISPFFLNVLLFTILIVSFTFYLKLVFETLIKRESLNLDFLNKYSLHVLLLSTMTLPIFSNDVFSIFSYSFSALHGVDIYSMEYNAIPSMYTKMSNPTYINLPCKYGPLSMLVSNFSVYIAKQNVALALIIYKFIFFIFGLIFIFFANKLDYQYRNLIILLIPIWWIQGVGQLHNDLFGVVFLLIALYFYYKKKNILITSVFIVFAILSKLTFVLFTLFPILDLFTQKKWKLILRYILYLVLFSMLFGLVFYSPFIDNPSQILTPLKAMNTERPSSTFTDIFAHIGLLMNSDFKTNYQFLIPIFKLIGILSMIFFCMMYLFQFYKKNANEKLILHLFLCLIFVFSHRFLPWYIMVMPLFLFYSKENEWLRWLLVLFYISTFQDFAIFINTNNIIGQMTMVLSTIITVGLFFYNLNKRL